MATLLFFIDVNTCSSFSSLAMFCTSLKWNSSNSTGTSPAWREIVLNVYALRTNSILFSAFTYFTILLCRTSLNWKVNKSALTVVDSHTFSFTLNTSLTAVISSGPTPSPGTIVTLKVESARGGGDCAQRPLDKLSGREASCCHWGPRRPWGWERKHRCNRPGVG